ncbi:MAG: hypothetical protein K0S78_6246 [Thermomicrobiales bacterium]|nr:hypothetical protein [Thermomicrobiales bacterium]
MAGWQARSPSDPATPLSPLRPRAAAPLSVAPPEAKSAPPSPPRIEPHVSAWPGVVARRAGGQPGAEAAGREGELPFVPHLECHGARRARKCPGCLHAREEPRLEEVRVRVIGRPSAASLA